jgi:hypothetical protein
LQRHKDTEKQKEQAALLADPTLAGLTATKRQRNVFTGKELAGAIADLRLALLESTKL